MQKPAKVLVTTVCLSLLIFIVTLIWLSYGGCVGLPQRIYHTALLGEKDFIGKNIRFKVRMQGTGRTSKGYSTDFMTARASDCIEVVRTTEPEGSPLEAENEMKMKVRAASSVIAQGPYVDSTSSQTLGERAILRYSKEPKIVVVMRRKDDSKLYMIESTSLAHALAFEKLIHNGYRFDPQGYLLPQGAD